MQVDAVIRGGTVFDGSGSAGVRTDVAIARDRVVALGEFPTELDALHVDATGHAVVPGFINVLSHAWAALQIDGCGTSDLLQGVTTEVFGEGFSLGPSNPDVDRLMRPPSAGPDGTGGIRSSFTRLADGLDHLVAGGVAPNVTSFVGGHNLRALVMGAEEGQSTPSQLARMKGILAEELQDGALGLGTALIYPPGSFADTHELAALCEVVADHSGLYISHLRSEGDQFLESLDELIDFGRRTGCRTEVHHLKAAGRHNWHKMKTAVERIVQARDSGHKVTANMYPYLAGGTALAASIPARFQAGGRRSLADQLVDRSVRSGMAAALRTHSDDFENLFLAAGPDGIVLGADLPDGTPARGQTLTSVARTLDLDDPAEALLEVVSRAPDMQALYYVADEDNLRLGLAQPWVSICSDAPAHPASPPHTDSETHPRTYGAFARALGHYGRREGLFSFSDGVRRMTSLPAETLGLSDRGKIALGAFADLVVLDPESFCDTATYDRPHSYAVGVKHVFVNGEQVVREGTVTGARPGRRLARNRG